MDDIHTDRKKHRERKAGVKANKKKAKSKPDQSLTPIQRNPKAFSVQHAQKAARLVQRSQEIKNKKHHIPLVDRTPLDPPPIIIGVVGPPKVGKTTLLQGIVKNYAKQKLSHVQGPVTIVSGKKRRLTLMECNNDINSMIDIAKVADLVLLMVDASFGFEMETFEFLNICQVHGFPKIMGVLTHLDRFKDNKKMRKMKKRFKHRFWTEVYAGAKLFYLSGMVYGEYPKQQVFNLCRFISVMKFRPLTWRTTHPYLLADRMEDITDPEKVRKNGKIDRNISLYGYIHGTMMKNNMNVHIPGCGDFSIKEMQFIADPCPTPDKEKKVRTLSQKDRIIYAPMSGVGGIVYDKDAVYIDVAGNQAQIEELEQAKPSNELVSSWRDMSNTLDEKMSATDVTMFSEASKRALTVARVVCESPTSKLIRTPDGRFRRLAVFSDDKAELNDDDDDDGDDDDEDGDGMSEDDDDNDYELDSDEGIQKDLQEPPNKKMKREKEAEVENIAYADTDDEMQDVSIFSQAVDTPSRRNDSNILTPGQKIKSDDSDSSDSIDYDDDSSDDDEDDSHVKDFSEDGLAAKTVKGPSIKSVKSSSSKSLSIIQSPLAQQVKSRTRREMSSCDSDSDLSEDDTVSLKNSSNVRKSDTKSGDIVSSKRSQVLLRLSKTVDSKAQSSQSGSSSSDSSDTDDSDQEVTDKKSKSIKSVKTQGSTSIQKKVTADSNKQSESEEESDDDSEDDNDSADDIEDNQNETSDNTDGDEEEDDDEEDEDLDSGEIRWKSNLAEEAAAAFRARQANKVNYRKLIYGEEVVQVEEDTGGDEIGGLFKIIKEKSEKNKKDRVSLNRTDCSKCVHTAIKDMSVQELQDLIADCFVTGKWEQSDDAEARLNMDDELYGDFEDLETGEKHLAKDTGDEGVSSEEDMDDQDANVTEELSEPVLKKTKAEMTADERRAEKKRKLKEMFNAQYDDKGSTDFYDNWKAQTEHQAKMNRSEFEDLDDELRVQYEGFRPGMYVRVEINDIPCELVTNFDPTYPLILGGLLSGESNIGYLQTRFKKHRWHKKILKTKNPLIISLGWRRFQSIPIYSIQDHNMRNRLLKYTPEHLHCHASLWGPITPQGTGILAVESVAGTQPGFRIAGTGVILELDKSMQIVKKLKLTGTPNKIYKKTAFIEGMFNSSLEVSKFEGASVRTVSGIRGQIKKAMSKPEGCYRATFEDQIVMSDIVFLRTWFPVEVPQFYNPVTSLLLPKGEKQSWTGMKSIGQLLWERNAQPKSQEDSLYKEIVRPKKTYKALTIPKTLKRNLPFKHTPKDKKKKDAIERLAVIREPHEKKIAKVLKMMKTLHDHKQRLQHESMAERVRRHQREVKKIWDSKNQKRKEMKKDFFRKFGKQHKDDNFIKD